MAMQASAQSTVQSERPSEADNSHHRFCQVLIQRHLDKRDEIVKHKPDEIKRLIRAAHEALKKDETLVEIKDFTGNVFIVGDLYGHYKCVWALLRIIGFPPGPKRRIVFLGNYGTRGNRGLETLATMLLLKAAWPDYVTLLRGNHECDQLGTMFGLNKLWAAKYGEKSWTSLCTHVFDWLPLAAVINKRVFACHGGISRQLVSGNSVQSIRRVQRPLDVPQTGLVCDLLWSCPQAENGWMGDENKITHKFGPDVVAEFLTSNDLLLLVRGMQCVEKGYLFYPTDRVLTLFSAVNWCADFANGAASLCVTCLGPSMGVRLQIKTYTIKPIEEPSTLMLSESEKESSVG